MGRVRVSAALDVQYGMCVSWLCCTVVLCYPSCVFVQYVFDDCSVAEVDFERSGSVR